MSNPISGLQLLFNNWGSKVFYLIYLLAPLTFIPLLASEPLIMAIPWIGASFIANYSPYYSIYHQYNAFIIPFVFVALLKAIEKLVTMESGFDFRRAKKMLLIIFLCTAIFGLYLPVAPKTPWNYQLPTPSERTKLLDEVLGLIPHNASILTQNDVFPHVSSRVNAFMYIPPRMDVTVDYILIDYTSGWYGWGPDISGEKLTPSDVVPEALRSEEYGILVSAKGILLLKKGYSDGPIVFVPTTAKYDYKALTLVSGSIIEDSTSSSGHVLYHDRGDDESIFWYGSYVNLLPGLYNVTYAVKIGSDVDPSDEVLKVDVTTQNGEALLAEKLIYGDQVSSKDQWFNVTLTFGLDNVAEKVEFGGFAYSNYEIYLDYIFIEQRSPKPS